MVYIIVLIKFILGGSMAGFWGVYRKYEAIYWKSYIVNVVNSGLFGMVVTNVYYYFCKLLYCGKIQL
jgi:hypothetical protein